MAPEIYRLKMNKKFKFNYSTDVFSFGIMLYELVFENLVQNAFREFSYSIYGINLVSEMARGKRPWINQRIVDDDNKWLIDLMKLCWYVSFYYYLLLRNDEPKKRPSFSQIILQIINNCGMTMSELQSVEIQKDQNLLKNKAFISANAYSDVTDISNPSNMNTTGTTDFSCSFSENEDVEEAFHEACKKGNIDFVKYHLFNVNIKDINKKILDGKSPLFHAVENNFVEIVDTLLFRTDIDINIMCEGKFPLFVCCENKCHEITKLLLKRDEIDLNLTLENGDNCITICLAKKRFKILFRLLNHPKMKFEKKVLERVNHEESFPYRDRIESIISHKVNKNILLSQFETKSFQEHFAEACENGYVVFVKDNLFNSKEVDINKKLTSKTPLYLAAEHNQVEIVRLLMNNSNLDVNIQCYDNEDMKTSLYISCEMNHPKIVKELLKHPQIEVCPKCIEIVCQKGNLESLKELTRGYDYSDSDLEDLIKQITDYDESIIFELIKTPKVTEILAFKEISLLREYFKEFLKLKFYSTTFYLLLYPNSEIIFNEIFNSYMLNLKNDNPLIANENEDEDEDEDLLKQEKMKVLINEFLTDSESFKKKYQLLNKSSYQICDKKLQKSRKIYVSECNFYSLNKAKTYIAKVEKKFVELFECLKENQSLLGKIILEKESELGIVYSKIDEELNNINQKMKEIKDGKFSYKGLFSNSNKFNSFGILFDQSKKKIFSGVYVEGLKKGIGRSFNNNKEVFYGNYLNNKKHGLVIKSTNLSNGLVIKSPKIYNNNLLVKDLEIKNSVPEIQEKVIKILIKKILDMDYFERTKMIIGKPSKFSTIYKFIYDDVYSFRHFNQYYFDNDTPKLNDKTYILKNLKEIINFNHPNICQIIAVSLSNPIGILYEFCEQTMTSFIINVQRMQQNTKNINFDEEEEFNLYNNLMNEKLKILSQCAHALFYIHSQNYVHNNLNWNNIFLDSSRNVKIYMDFTHHNFTHFKENSDISENIYTDIKSFGVLIFELIFDTLIFDKKFEKEADKIEYVLHELIKLKSINVTNLYYVKLLKDCLMRNVKSFDQILNRLEDIQSYCSQEELDYYIKEEIRIRNQSYDKKLLNFLIENGLESYYDNFKEQKYVYDDLKHLVKNENFLEKCVDDKIHRLRLIDKFKEIN